MIKIAHLYPDMLNLYGDRGNIIALTKRMELRGISTQVDRITMGKSFNADDYGFIPTVIRTNTAKPLEIISEKGSK